MRSSLLWFALAILFAGVNVYALLRHEVLLGFFALLVVIGSTSLSVVPEDAR